MSSESIDKRTKRASSIVTELDGSSVGIVVLTLENMKDPWIYFEAGALANAVGGVKLFPLICGLKPSDIGTPLSQFQFTVFNREDVLKLLRNVNECAGDDALPSGRLEKMHDALWDDLWSVVEPVIVSSDSKNAAGQNKPGDETLRILEELLALSRQQSRILLSPDGFIPSELILMMIDAVNNAGVPGADLDRIRFMARNIYTRWSDLNDTRSSVQLDDNPANA